MTRSTLSYWKRSTNNQFKKFCHCKERTSFEKLYLQGLTFLINFLKFVCKVKYLPTKFWHSILPKVSSTVRKFKGETQFICWKSCYIRRFDNILSTTIFEEGSLLSTSPLNSEKRFFHGIDFLFQRRPHISIIGTLPKPT